MNHGEPLLFGEAPGFHGCFVVVVAMENTWWAALRVRARAGGGGADLSIRSPTSVVSPPKVRTAFTLMSGVARGMTMTPRQPNLDALMATPCQKREWLACQSQAWMQHRVNEGLRTCAWLPAEHATTPRASCSSGNFTNLLKAPRILNEFTGCVSCSNRAKACVGPLQIDSSRKPYIWYGPFEFYLAL